MGDLFNCVRDHLENKKLVNNKKRIDELSLTARFYVLMLHGR